ncbi:protease modulator HflC [Anaerocolumna aminovalerica]|jgi:membrane protease subunit HflC|uniref:Protein HflC n=1 Tax=Anaerocolumna aminovalerica TaxID=1527 RepID=A0A1I5EVC4_9FIRM|nr:protease modulator HflC [Anaerocolumna aminovalerica]MBU5332674.1 protease modulator HflC [Anaerocolumna aminovalerica]MDU6265884.1 protease modulator HflC [Anaerocolumna aminovalerica]SFO15363.1 membrane protease subunit HflC [Anaerocolumna aminovalerica]
MKKKIGFSIILIFAIILLFSSIIITNENEYKLVREFGKVQNVIDKPGISLIVPFIQTADTLPKEILLYDLAPSDVITMDKKTMISDSYVLWRITDPLKFAQSLNSSVTNAENRIDTVVYNALKNVISSNSQTEIINERDDKIAEAIMENLGNSMDQYGLTILAVETKRLDLPADNKSSVYQRMISERDKIAATYIAEGNSEAQVIKNTTDKEISISLSTAKAEAERIIAEGEAEYMKILAEAYADNSRTEFYSFVRSLDAAKSSLQGNNKTLILPADSPISQIFLGK